MLRLQFARLGLLIVALSTSAANANLTTEIERGENLVASGKPAVALAVLEAANTKTGPTEFALSSRVNLALAQAQHQLGKIIRAIKHYSVAIELNPYSDDALYGRGLSFLQTGLYKKAVSDFNRVLAINPNRAIAYAQRGAAHQELHHAGRPLSDYSHAIGLNPKLVVAYHYRSNLYLYQGRFDAAAKDFARHEELEPNQPYVRIKGLISARRAGQTGDAWASLLQKTSNKDWPGKLVSLFTNRLSAKQLLAEIPTNPQSAGKRCEAYYYLGQHALLENEPTAAKKYFQRAIDTDAKNYSEYDAARAELWRLDG